MSRVPVTEYVPDVEIVDPSEWDDVPTSPGVIAPMSFYAAEAFRRLAQRDAEDDATREFDT